MPLPCSSAGWERAVDVGADAQALRQVAAGRVAQRADAMGVDLQPLGIRPEPADRGLHIFDGGRKRKGRGEAVLHGHGHEAAPSQFFARPLPTVATAAGPAAAMNADHGRRQAIDFAGPRQVELEVLIFGIAVLDVALDFDLVGGRRSLGRRRNNRRR